MVEARYHQFVTIHQFYVLRAARVSQRLVEVDTHGIGGAQCQLMQRDRVARIARRLTRHTNHRADTCLLVVVHLTHQSGTTDVSTFHDAACRLDEVGETHVLTFHGVGAAEHHLTIDRDGDGVLIGRTAANLYDVERFEDEVLIVRELEVLVDGERVGFIQIQARIRGTWVMIGTRHIHLGSRSRIGQATCLQDEVLDGHAVRILVSTREDDLAQNRYRTLVLMFRDGGDIEHVLVLQRHVRFCTGHDALQIDGEHLLGAVRFQTAQYCTTRHGRREQSIGTLYQALDAEHLLAQTIHARTRHGTRHLYHILIEVEVGIDADMVAIRQFEGREVELLDIEHILHGLRIAEHTDRLFVGIAGEAASIADERLQALPVAQLVAHGALHPTRDADETVIGTYLDDIVVLQAHIACQSTAEDELIDIDHRHQFSLAIELDVTKRSQATDATRQIEGVVDGRQGAQRISTRHADLTQHVDLDGACLTQGDTDVRALEVFAQTSADAVLGSTNLQTAHLNGTELRNIDVALGTHLQLEALPGGAIDVDHQYIARSQDIVLGSGNIHIRCKGQSGIVKDVAAKNLTTRATTNATTCASLIILFQISLVYQHVVSTCQLHGRVDG